MSHLLVKWTFMPMTLSIEPSLRSTQCLYDGYAQGSLAEDAPVYLRGIGLTCLQKAGHRPLSHIMGRLVDISGHESPLHFKTRQYVLGELTHIGIFTGSEQDEAISA